MQPLLDLLQSSKIRQIIGGLDGYDTSETGKQMAQDEYQNFRGNNYGKLKGHGHILPLDQSGAAGA